MSEDTAKEKIEVTKEELKEIIDERVEKKLRKQKQEEERTGNEQVSRRKFLKKMGVGALGLGALTLPTSALNLRSNNLQYYGGENETDAEFEIDSNGNISAYNTLNMNNSKITGLNDPENPSDAATQNWTDNNYLKISNYTPESDTHSKYTDDDARGAVEAGDVNNIPMLGSAYDASNPETVEQGTIGVGEIGGSDGGHISFFANDSSWEPNAITLMGGEGLTGKVGDIIFGNEGGGSDLDIHGRITGSTGEIDWNNSININGNQVATQNWVNDNISEYSDSKAQDAVLGTSLQRNHGYSYGDVTASGNDQSTDWNQAHLFQLESSNNALTFFIPDQQNQRKAFIQGGHASGGYSDYYSTLDINPFGGQVQVNGDRVATRNWVNNNADVPNADYANNAGDADTVDGKEASELGGSVSSSDQPATGNLELRNGNILLDGQQDRQQSFDNIKNTTVYFGSSFTVTEVRARWHVSDFGDERQEFQVITRPGGNKIGNIGPSSRNASATGISTINVNEPGVSGIEIEDRGDDLSAYELTARGYTETSTYVTLT